MIGASQASPIVQELLGENFMCIYIYIIVYFDIERMSLFLICLLPSEAVRESVISYTAASR